MVHHAVAGEVVEAIEAVMNKSQSVEDAPNLAA
jgi:hypothetical protein